VTLIILCGGVAFTSHSTKAATRLLVNHSPEPFSNIGISLAEMRCSFGYGFRSSSSNRVWTRAGFLVVFIGRPKVFRAVRFNLPVFAYAWSGRAHAPNGASVEALAALNPEVAAHQGCCPHASPIVATDAGSSAALGLETPAAGFARQRPRTSKAEQFDRLPGAWSGRSGVCDKARLPDRVYRIKLADVEQPSGARPADEQAGCAHGEARTHLRFKDVEIHASHACKRREDGRPQNKNCEMPR